jgi:hypothetical protein
MSPLFTKNHIEPPKVAQLAKKSPNLVTLVKIVGNMPMVADIMIKNYITLTSGNVFQLNLCHYQHIS